MSIELLSTKELRELTEYQRKAEQCRELKRLGVDFTVSRSGKPLVLRDTVIALLSGRVRKRPDFVAPDLDALKKLK